MFIRNKGIATQLGWPFIGLVATALLLAACGSSSVPAATSPPTEPPPTATPEPPTPEPPTSTPELATPTPEPPTPTPEPPTPTPEPPTPTPEPPTPTPEPPTPTPEPPTPESATATPSSGAQSGAANFLDDIFPPGHEGERDLVLYTCGSCHAWVCAVMWQRPVEHWRTIQATHEDLVSGLGDEESQLVFDFLAENFNDTKPEPDLPEALQDLGCTTQ